MFSWHLLTCEASSTSRKAARRFYSGALLNPHYPGIYWHLLILCRSGHMIAFFMHITFSLGSPRGEGGGVIKPPKPPRSAPATSLVIFFSILIYRSSYIICWSFRITRFQRIHTVSQRKILHVSVLARSSPAPADIGRQRAHRYYRRSISSADGCTASFRCLYR